MTHTPVHIALDTAAGPHENLTHEGVFVVDTMAIHRVVDGVVRRVSKTERGKGRDREKKRER